MMLFNQADTDTLHCHITTTALWYEYSTLSSVLRLCTVC